MGGHRLPACSAPRRAFDLGKAVGDFLADDEETCEVPKDVEALVQGLKESTENTLSQGIGQIDVEIPPSFKFGVEGDKKKGRMLGSALALDNIEEVSRSDRELARLFVEMMQVMGEGIVVAFRKKSLAKQAKREWNLSPGEASVIAFPEAAKSAFAAEVGAPARFRKDLRKLGCQLLLVVAPQVDQLRIINELSKDVQDQMGIFLLNSRIHGRGRKTIKIPTRLKTDLQKVFAPTYHVRFLGDEQRKNGVLFHRMLSDGPGEWVLAQQREILGGQPVTSDVLRTKQEPTEEAIQNAFKEFDKRERDFGDKVLDFVDKDNLR